MTRVRLLHDDLKGGRKSLYLNIYLGDGKYSRKALGLYLKPETTKDNKAYNKLIRQEAEILRNKLELDLLNKKLGKEDPKKRYDNSFINYFERIVAHRYETEKSYDAWHSVKQHLLSYTNGKLTFDEVDEIWLESFRSYLLKKVSQNSASTYFNKIKHVLHLATRERIYELNPGERVAAIKTVTRERSSLTLDEVKLLVSTDCRLPEMKQAFLFSCFTGLRWADVIKLKWENVSEENGETYIRYYQQKTKNFEILPLSDDALKMMGDKGEDKDKVFPKLKYSAWHNSILSQWVLIAGIRKHITFHCARHTYATLLITHGVQLYTVSKILGHRDIKTTEIYVKLLNHKKVEAVKSLPSIL